MYWVSLSWFWYHTFTQTLWTNVITLYVFFTGGVKFLYWIRCQGIKQLILVKLKILLRESLQGYNMPIALSCFQPLRWRFKTKNIYFLELSFFFLNEFKIRFIKSLCLHLVHHSLIPWTIIFSSVRPVCNVSTICLCAVSNSIPLLFLFSASFCRWSFSRWS